MIAAAQPLDPNPAISSGTMAGGVAMTARSGGSARSFTVLTAVMPSIVLWCGLTRPIAPPNPPRQRFLRTAPPTEYFRGLPPMRATERGLKIRSRRYVLIRYDRAGSKVRVGLMSTCAPGDCQRALLADQPRCTDGYKGG